MMYPHDHLPNLLQIIAFLCLAYFALHTCRLCLENSVHSNYFLNKFFIKDATLVKFAELIKMISMIVHTKNKRYSL